MDVDRLECPTCKKPMELVRVTPSILQWPELHTYQCKPCGYVETVEIKDGGK